LFPWTFVRFNISSYYPLSSSVQGREMGCYCPMGAPPNKNGRNLVICIDGTSNKYNKQVTSIITYRSCSGLSFTLGWFPLEYQPRWTMWSTCER
jgi:hypothetical protein